MMHVGSLESTMVLKAKLRIILGPSHPSFPGVNQLFHSAAKDSEFLWRSEVSFVNDMNVQHFIF